MNTVTIEIERGKGERFDFISWKDDRRAFYAKLQRGKPRVVTLTPACPEGAQWTSEPFPECAPVEITPCRLLPPPCRETEKEWESSLLDEWEAAYFKTHGQFLCLTPEDDEPLKAWMDEYKDAARRDYEQEKKDLTKLPLERLGLTDEAERRKQLEALELRYTEPLHTFHSIECAGSLNMTLGMVKQGCGELPSSMCIRDAHLIEGWAKREKIDLALMDTERAGFKKWMETHCGVLMPVSDMIVTKTKRWDIVPPGFYGERDPRFMALCAAVRCRTRFQDGSVVYLTGCELREELRAAELAEVVTITGGPNDTETVGRLAQAQQTLSSGILLTGSLGEKMKPEDILLFNLLKENNPKRPGWALPYREIGERLNISQTEVQRRRRELEQKYGREITHFIAEARQLNDKRIHPDRCDSGHEIKTKGTSDEY